MLTKYAWGLTFSLVVVGVLYFGKPLLMPFVLAVFIWYLINALTDAYKVILPSWIPRPIAFCAALITMCSAIYFASWLIMSNISGVAAAAPAYQYNLEQMSRRLFAYIPWGEPLTIGKLVAGIDFSSVARVVVSEVTHLFGKGAIVAIYLLFLFFEQGSMREKISKLIPSIAGNVAGEKDIDKIIKRITHDIRMYLGIKTVVSIVTAVISYAIFLSIGLNFASFWAFLIFLFNYIPAVGSIVSTALPALFALMQYESIVPCLVTLIGVTAIQMIMGNIIEPKFQGDRLNLSPIVILLSLALWNMIWGISGMFLCVPLTAIAMIIFSNIPQTRFIAIALSRNGNISEKTD